MNIYKARTEYFLIDQDKIFILNIFSSTQPPRAGQVNSGQFGGQQQIWKPGSDKRTNCKQKTLFIYFWILLFDDKVSCVPNVRQLIFISVEF